jgi:hypothetical protein
MKARDKWGLEAGYRSVRPTCHRPGCTLTPADPTGPGEESEYCAHHLASIRAIRAALSTRKGKGGPKETPACGTERGFGRHKRNRQVPCPDCETAHLAFVAEHGAAHNRGRKAS